MVLFKTIIMLAGFLLFLVRGHCEGIYKWTDASGKTHYGDSVSSKQNPKAKSVDIEPDSVTEQRRQHALLQNQKEKEKADYLGKQRKKADESNAPIVTLPRNARPLSSREMCEDVWKKYDESSACFEQYRLPSGGVRGEAYKHCTPLKLPECVRQKKTPYVGEN